MNRKVIRRFITLGLVVVLWVVFALTTKSFVTLRNTQQLLKESAFVGLIACGICFAIVSGGIDLSAGGIVCVAGICCARFSFTGAPGIVVLLIGVLTGALIGCFNAFYITKLHLPPFVATLAAGNIYLGLGLVFAFHENGSIIAKSVTNKSYLLLGKNAIGIYWITLAWIIVAAILYFVMTKTVFGTHIYAVGSNERSAEMSGIKSAKTRAIGFIICGACCGMAAAFQVAYQNSATVQLGSGYEFQGIAACVVGGCVLGGGKGDPIGAFLGAIFMTMILNGLNKYGLNASWQYIAEGVIIVAATAFDAGFNGVMAKRQAQRQMKKSAEAKLLKEGGA